MIKVYIAGAYTANTDEQITKNIEQADNMFHYLLSRGYAPFSSHLKSGFRHTRGDDFDKTYDLWMDYSLTFLEVCDVMLILEGYEKSKGVAMEIEYAKQLDIPVFYNTQILERWHRGAV